MFIDRDQELAFLDAILTRQHPGPAQFLLLYGRRRPFATARGRAAITSATPTSASTFASWRPTTTLWPSSRTGWRARCSRAKRAFVGQTAFEDLARQWVVRKGRAGQLSFHPEVAGSHWSRAVQVDVVAVNWQERAILLGECKWGTEAVGQDVLRELVDVKTPRVLKDLPDGGQGWQVRHAIFARAGFTAAAQAAAQAGAVTLVDLPALAAGLQTS